MPAPPAITRSNTLSKRYQTVRDFTDQIAAPLSAEDCMIQSMPDASPTRWHMAHTTWFFETFILAEQPDYVEFDPQFRYLFNSYYNAVGSQFPRSQRGVISRPDFQQTQDYRRHVDEHMQVLFESNRLSPTAQQAIEIGLNHEQQHQELMLTDIKHAFSLNPLLPAYDSTSLLVSPERQDSGWVDFPEAIHEIGKTEEGFGFDNESPRHRVLTGPYALANRTVDCGAYLKFIEDGGYQRPDHWLSLGWDMVQRNQWTAPLYWVNRDNQWMIYTMAGLVPLCEAWPVCHVSYFEADAFARWAGYRLPTEFEWEAACPTDPSQQFADCLTQNRQAIHPQWTAAKPRPLEGMLGGVWEWTSSSYAAYPGYTPPDGAFGEYNGKFMCNQYVLRGGSVATSQSHIRKTYRNFFPPEARWQFSGIRLAK